MPPETLDRINAVLEATGFIPTLWECWVMYRRKSARGASLLSHGYWTCVGIWWLFYFAGINQPWTLAAVAIWFSAYCCNTAMVVRYRNG